MLADVELNVATESSIWQESPADRVPSHTMVK